MTFEISTKGLGKFRKKNFWRKAGKVGSDERSSCWLADPAAAMAGKTRVSMLLNPEDKDSAACPICMRVLEDPTQGCSEGHPFCRDCYTTWLETNQNCPLCRQTTDASR